jgi:uncharacterized protein (TIGR03067 family)
MIATRIGRFSCLVVALAALGAAGLRADEPKASDEAKADLKKMQGEWVSKDDQGGESTWTFKDDHLSLKTPTRAYEIKVSLDPKAKPHPAMDMKVQDDSPNAKGVDGKAIYKFDGEKKLTICFSADGGTRPTEFETDFGRFIFSMDLEPKEKK